MYIYQNGKLYVQKDSGKLVGVEIHSNKNAIEVSGTETELGEIYDVCTPYEVTCRFHISEDNPYIFSTEPKDEVTKIEPVKHVQGTRKPKGK